MDADSIWAAWQTITSTINSTLASITSAINSGGAWPMIASAVIGGIISQIITLIVGLLTKPRLRLQIGNVVPLLILAPRPDSPTGSATWIRVRVKNWGWRDAQTCRVYLTDVIKRGETEPILKKDAMTLWASAGGDRDHRDPLTIS